MLKFFKIPAVFIIGSMLMLCFFSSCEESVESSLACTAVFKAYGLNVFTPNGHPADSVKIDIIAKETGREINPCKNDGLAYCNEKSPYVILHDGFSEKISKDGEKIIVKGTKRNLSFTENFTFRFDGCHIRKVAGPDTVRLSR